MACYPCRALIFFRGSRHTEHLKRGLINQVFTCFCLFRSALFERGSSVVTGAAGPVRDSMPLEWKAPPNKISHFRKLLIAARCIFATQPITLASSINPNTGMPSGIRSSGLTKYRTAAHYENRLRGSAIPPGHPGRIVRRNICKLSQEATRNSSYRCALRLALSIRRFGFSLRPTCDSAFSAPC